MLTLASFLLFVFSRGICEDYVGYSYVLRSAGETTVRVFESIVMGVFRQLFLPLL